MFRFWEFIYIYMKLILGDCLEKLKELPDNSIDSVVTDPPYGIGFMNKEWDSPEKLRQQQERDLERTKVRNENGTAPVTAKFSPFPGQGFKGRKEGLWFQQWCEEWGKECLRVLKPGGHLLSFSAPRMYHRMTTGLEEAGFEIRDQIMWVFGSGFPKGKSQLKPAHEPIVMARKPGKIEPLNIDDCRIEYKDDKPHSVSTEREGGNSWNKDYQRTEDWEPNNEGRWPANVIMDEGEEPWRRYFYCPKINKKDREDMNNHPTVKPTELMLYLIKLVTPKGGTVLEPFMGSGSTGKAAIRGGYDFVGIEKEEEYLKIAKARIENEYGGKH